MTLKTPSLNNSAGLKISFLSLFFCIPFFIHSQSVEDCNNGFDDDGDGLIDCFDTDCTCTAQCDSFYYNACIPDCHFRPPCNPISLATKWVSNAETGTFSPVVAGDMDGDGIPEVVTTRVEQSDLYILDGVTGQIKVHIVEPSTLWPGGTAPAIGDLDNDGFGEIVIVGYDRKLHCYEHTGAPKYTSSVLVGYDQRYQFAVPNIADFDHDGWPEVNIGNQVFNGQTGALLASGSNLLSDGEHPARVAVGYSFASTVPVDVMPDNACFGCQGLEIVAGNQVLSVNLNTGLVLPVAIAPLTYSDGFTSVADFDGDGDLDAIVQGQKAGQNTVYVWDIQTNTIMREFQLLNNWSEGASRVNVADLDGDSLPDISFVGHPWLYALRNDFTPLWVNPVNDPSSITCTSVFDFCGDGTSDVIYRSEDKLQILDGATGNVIWEDICRSLTHIENPLVLDVDADGKTEILIECGTNGSFFDGTVIAYEIVGSPDVVSRPVWNQHGYFNTNINDDLSVPRFQQKQQLVGNKRRMNTFMNQYSFPTFPSPDATLSLINQPLCGQDSFQILIEICNVGDNFFPLNTPISAYIGNPQTTAAQWIGIVAASATIAEGACDTLIIRVPRIVNDSIFLVLNDDHSILPPFDLTTDFPATSIAECVFANNITGFYFHYQPDVVFLGQDTAICDLSTMLLNAAGQDLVGWVWTNNSNDSTFTAQGPGIYAVTVTDICNFTQTDTIVVGLDTSTMVDIGPDQGICPGDSATLTVSGFDAYTWEAGVTLSCTTCSSVSLAPLTPTWVTLKAAYSYGCSARDSALIYLHETFDYAVDTTICYGSAVVWNGQSIEPDSSRLFALQTIHGCDSIVLVRVLGTGIGTYNFTVDTAVCLGSTLSINNVDLAAEEEMTFHLTASTGCDSTVLVRVAPKDTFFLYESRVICFGDSSNVFGAQQTTSGDYPGYFTASNGCDSTQLVSLFVYPQIQLEIDGTTACFGESNASLTASITDGVDPLLYVWNTGNLLPGLDNVPAGDYALTVTDGNNCTETAAITINEHPQAIFTIEIDSADCFDEYTGGIQILTNDPSLLFQFNGGPFTQVVDYPELHAGTYYIVSQDVYDCQDTIASTVLQPPPLSINLPADTSIQLGVSLPLQIGLDGLTPIEWIWSDTTYLSCLECPNPIVQTPLETRRYVLTIKDINGCTATDEMLLMVEQFIGVYIPNAMGGTGENTNLVLGFNPAVRQVNLFRVFDRWGELLHETRNALPGDNALTWDGRYRGKLVNPGVYLWQIELELVDGTVLKKLGDLTVIR
ncbi:MAG: FG-GAP-like repeat-containing protein [Saprospiraceae bacterium]|nr:FG-GAP-like repeat-containing protein [Saprospiraceae bacterium]